MTHNQINMTEFHPDDSLLIEYSAGTLPASVSLAISVHLEYCPCCKKKLERLNTVAATLFEQPERSKQSLKLSAQAETVKNDSELLDAIFDRIDVDQTSRVGSAKITVTPPQPICNKSRLGLLPSKVNKLLNYSPDKLKWRTHGRNVTSARLSQYDGLNSSLIRIKRNAKIPQHTHNGVEYTVVLEGSFSDEDGIYKQGDFITRTESDDHAPVATANSDCLCLVVMDAPLKFKNPLLELYNKVMPL